ncbi:ABC transporter permease [Lacihabitans sp. LS3-19]|uniref:ABC transporter permease n=1 Tax=Lacihabitans sp. LS3-19 TaxID=2487335 RepID=UPI0020CC6199|nr:ABC transporter permease [Lacihabitans sp. LS3-19]MCP9769835.1 ABC transporter permease [Lacihabitans sp. LS3-19]
MNLKENIAEGLRSIKGNLLRTVLTAAIITFGIMALVGILTAIEGMQGSVNKSFEGLGVNTFDIKVEQNNGRRRRGIVKKQPKPIYFRQAIDYKENFTKKTNAIVSIYTFAGQSETIKYETEKSNPNITVLGADENYLPLKGYKLQSGRNITENDRFYSNKMVLIGNEIAQKFFPNVSPLGKNITLMGEKFNIAGVLEKKGSITGGDDDRVAIIPLEVARNFDQKGSFSYEITTSVPDAVDLDYTLAEATSVMRIVRGDKVYDEDSFKIERSDALLSDLNEVTGYLRIGGFGISIITLLGASIALMNIMMVSVTERTREIGVRKALGASPKKIRLQFLIEAIVICIIGGLAGVILGIGAGNLVSYFMTGGGSFVVPWNWITLGLVVCIVVGLLSGYYPAYKASKLDPIESLRYE